MLNNNLLNFHAMQYMEQEARLRYVENTPILPKSMQEQVKAAYDRGTVIQNYAIAVVSQPVLDYPPAQEVLHVAQQHASTWLDNLDPEVILRYSSLRSYLKFIKAFNKEDFDKLVRDKDKLEEVIQSIMEATEDTFHPIQKLDDKFRQFGIELEKDVRNFVQISSQADEKYHSECNAMLPIPTITIGSELVKVDGATVAIAVKQLTTEREPYPTTAGQQSSSNCNLLRQIIEQFKLLKELGEKAVEAAKVIFEGWDDIFLSLKALEQDLKEILQNDSLRFLVKKMLEKFLGDASQVYNLVESLERQGILPIAPDQEVWNGLHQGRSRIPALPEQPLPLDEYLALVKRRNLLGQSVRCSA